MLLCVFCNAFGFAQSNDLISKAEEFLLIDIDETIKITEYTLKDADNQNDISRSNLILGNAYVIKGLINEAVVHAFDFIEEPNSIQPKTLIDIYILRSKLLRTLHLIERSKNYLSKAKKVLINVDNADSRKEFLAFITIEEINLHLHNLNYKNALVLIELIAKDFPELITNHKKFQKAFNDVNERTYRGVSNYESAFKFMNKNLVLIYQDSIATLYDKAKTYNNLGQLHLQLKNFKKSEESFFIALRFARLLENPFLLKDINKNLIINYIGSKQKTKYKVYKDEFNTFNIEANLIEQKAVSSLYDSVLKQSETLINFKESTINKSIYIIIGSSLLFIFVLSFFLFRQESKKKRLSEVVKYLEITRSNLISTKPKVKVKKTTKGIHIPKETERIILAKLKQFEKSKKYLNKGISLAVVAGQFDTNTKYLSGVINSSYQDNFSTFINKLRINYIINKLKSDFKYTHYKISYLAEECGYSSHSNFATVFKSIVGMSPATFIELVRKERKEKK